MFFLILDNLYEGSGFFSLKFWVFVIDKIFDIIDYFFVGSDRRIDWFVFLIFIVVVKWWNVLLMKFVEGINLFKFLMKEV